MQAALSDAMSAKNRPPEAGLFGPDAFARLALDPRTRAFMDQPDFRAMMASMQSNPQLINMYLKDPRMQLVCSIVL